MNACRISPGDKKKSTVGEALRLFNTPPTI